MVSQLVPAKEVITKLAFIGVPIDPKKSDLAKRVWAVFGEGELKKENVQQIVNFAKSVGTKNFSEFLGIVNKMSLMRQNAPYSKAERIARAVNAFGKPLESILHNKELGLIGKVSLRVGEAPFLAGIEIHDAANIAFKFFFTPSVPLRGKAKLFLGNFHITNEKQVDSIWDRKTRGGFPERVINIFSDAFSSSGAKVFATSMHMHHGYYHANPAVLLVKMHQKGILSADEINIYTSSKEFEHRVESFKKKKDLPALTFVPKTAYEKVSRLVDEKLAAELARVRHAGTVSHKIGYLHAGFRVKKKHLQKAKLAGGKKIMKRTNKINPLWPKRMHH